MLINYIVWETLLRKKEPVALEQKKLFHRYKIRCFRIFQLKQNLKK